MWEKQLREESVHNQKMSNVSEHMFLLGVFKKSSTTRYLCYKVEFASRYLNFHCFYPWKTHVFLYSRSISQLPVEFDKTIFQTSLFFRFLTLPTLQLAKKKTTTFNRCVERSGLIAQRSQPGQTPKLCCWSVNMTTAVQQLLAGGLFTHRAEEARALHKRR